MSIPGYELLSRMAQSSMSALLRCREQATGRVVCIELFRAAWLGHESPPIPQHRRQGAILEAASVLAHENIWPVLYLGEADGRYYQVRPLPPGDLLASHLAGGGWPAPSQAALWARQLALAAHHAHEHGIVHRDIKPANVFLRNDGVPMLYGFELALADFLHPSLADPEPHAVVGTPLYMAPEQIRGEHEALSPAVDVWSLGVVLFEMLTRQRPFQYSSAIGSITEMFQAILTREPPALGGLAAGIDGELERICLRCLAKQPGQRHASALELADELGRYLLLRQHSPPAGVS